MFLPSSPDAFVPQGELPRVILTSPIVDAIKSLERLRDQLRACSPSSDSIHALTEAGRLIAQALVTASADDQWVPISDLATNWGVPADTVQRWAVRERIRAKKQGGRWYAPASTTPPSLGGGAQ